MLANAAVRIIKNLRDEFVLIEERAASGFHASLYFVVRKCCENPAETKAPTAVRKILGYNFFLFFWTASAIILKINFCTKLLFRHCWCSA